MTRTEMTWPKAIPGFSVLKMKQEIQDKIYQETKDMTTEEFLEYIRQGAERFREKSERRKTEANQ